jgi:Tol biopolymer transport system component/DNA-binding winged helix-turn-helix (wHTH) protein
MNQDQQSPATPPSTSANHAFCVGDWLVEPELNRIQRGGEKAHLEPKVMEVLVCLSRANGSVVSKERLIRQVWQDTFVTDDVLKGSIWQLRKAFQDDSKHPKVIETIPKGGYRLLLQVRAAGAEVGSPEAQAIGALSGRKSKRWARIAGVALAALAGASGVLFLTTRKHPEASLEIVPFTALPGSESFPSFSPDGNQIAFTYNDGKEVNIFVKAIGDEKMLQLTGPPGRSMCPQWSPDGRLIAYWYTPLTKPGSREWTIYVMTPLGGAKHKIMDIKIIGLNASEGCLISWSHDSKLIVYADRPSAGEPSGIFIVEIADAKPRRLTTPPNQTDDLNPSVSHDGKQVVFLRQTSYATGDLYVVPILGGEPTRLTFRNGYVQGPIWTSDDKRILFTFGPDAGDLYSVAVSGGTPERLPFSNGDVAFPALSPRGDKLVYTKARVDFNIWKVSLSDSTEPPKKFIASTQPDTSPDFSPDGSKIAIYSERDGTQALWICNADGSDPTRLWELHQGGTPRWSPNGRQIAFDSRPAGRSHIYLISPEGGTPVQFTPDEIGGMAPYWSGDGNWIYFSSLHTGTWQIWKISTLTKEAIQVTHHDGLLGQVSPNGKVVYYQKPESASGSSSGPKPGIWTVPSEGGPERLLLPPANWSWQVRPEGIYYVDNSAQPHPLVQLFRFATGKIMTIGHLDKPPMGGPWLAISPDGHTLLYSQIDSNTSDLMLVKNGKW